MNNLKKKYLERIRKETAYSFLREFLNVTLFLSVFASVLYLFAAIIQSVSAFQSNTDEYKHLHFAAALSCLGYVVLSPILGFLTKQSGLLLIDIADSIIDLNSRYEGQ